MTLPRKLNQHKIYVINISLNVSIQS